MDGMAVHMTEDIGHSTPQHHPQGWLKYAGRPSFEATQDSSLVIDSQLETISRSSPGVMVQLWMLPGRARP